MMRPNTLEVISIFQQNQLITFAVIKLRQGKCSEIQRYGQRCVKTMMETLRPSLWQFEVWAVSPTCRGYA